MCNTEIIICIHGESGCTFQHSHGPPVFFIVSINIPVFGQEDDIFGSVTDCRFQLIGDSHLIRPGSHRDKFVIWRHICRRHYHDVTVDVRWHHLVHHLFILSVLSFYISRDFFQFFFCVRIQWIRFLIVFFHRFSSLCGGQYSHHDEDYYSRNSFCHNSQF